MKSQIIYCKTDEAPALAKESFLPIIKKFLKPAEIEIQVKDISLAGRILSQFSDYPDALEELGQLVKTSDANIIKLPNISASIPQLKGAIAELQAQGYDLPPFPENPQDETQEQIRGRYAKVLGSAVNPVLRLGNSDRRVAKPVKEFAQKHPHSMGAWSQDSKSHVASMQDGDFYSSEKSVTIKQDTHFRIEFINEKGEVKTLKEKAPLLAGEIIDGAVMSFQSLNNFFIEQIKVAKKEGVLLSLHLKATMMRVSDPIFFGFAVTQYFHSAFEKNKELFADLGINPNNGIGDVYSKIEKLDATQKEEVLKDLEQCYKEGPALAMVDSDKGITNLHVPSDVIIDASMPAAIRTSGQMWGADGHLHDTKAMIPDRSYAGVYQATIDFCKKNGAFDPSTMGSVSNVGLMAKKAQEYGSHDKTFQIKQKGQVRVVDEQGQTLLEHEVCPGDVWRMCQTKQDAIKDWVKLAVNRARITNDPTIFWLDPNRSHDSHLIEKVKENLKLHEVDGLDIQILSPIEATHYTLDRTQKGLNTISVTGNVLRDYLTDLFPILELGTSAKMLSIVPLLSGGALFETGAGGSAPKHVQQFLEQGHLRWDSLGEFLALAVSLEELAEKTKNKKAKILAEALDQANTQYLNQNKSPSRKVKELDNRGSHFYLALYWAKALAEQEADADLKEFFLINI